MSKPSQPRPPVRESAEARRDRLAAELRANLAKRKTQARARAATAAQVDDHGGHRGGDEGPPGA